MLGLSITGPCPLSLSSIILRPLGWTGLSLGCLWTWGWPGALVVYFWVLKSGAEDWNVYSGHWQCQIQLSLSQWLLGPPQVVIVHRVSSHHVTWGGQCLPYSSWTAPGPAQAWLRALNGHVWIYTELGAVTDQPSGAAPWVLVGAFWDHRHPLSH